ncbi:hypothetical protein E4T43_05352 [Aureobasidium subglaciale]|nr:hypothetical protein E4T43_05352 [Aureobasidium subglaciale]
MSSTPPNTIYLATISSNTIKNTVFANIFTSLDTATAASNKAITALNSAQQHFEKHQASTKARFGDLSKGTEACKAGFLSESGVVLSLEEFKRKVKEDMDRSFAKIVEVRRGQGHECTASEDVSATKACESKSRDTTTEAAQSTKDVDFTAYPPAYFGDFGISFIASKFNKSGGGPTEWYAPEQAIYKQEGLYMYFHTNIWQLGLVMLYAIAADDLHDSTILENKEGRQICFEKAESAGYSLELRDLIDVCRMARGKSNLSPRSLPLCLIPLHWLLCKHVINEPLQDFQRKHTSFRNLECRPFSSHSRLTML